MKRLVAIAILILVGCSPAAVKPVTIRGGESSLTDLPAGSYTFAWTTECTGLQLSWAPTSGAEIPIPVDGPNGSTMLAIPGGRAYVNGSASCPSGASYVVTITPAAAPG